MNIVCNVKRGTNAVAEKARWKFTFSPICKTLQHEFILWIKNKIHNVFCALRVPVRVWMFWVWVKWWQTGIEFYCKVWKWLKNLFFQPVDLTVLIAHIIHKSCGVNSHKLFWEQHVEAVNHFTQDADTSLNIMPPSHIVVHFWLVLKDSCNWLAKAHFLICSIYSLQGKTSRSFYLHEDCDVRLVYLCFRLYHTEH